MNTPDWLVARPIAHRGLHDKTKGRVENSLAAAQAAIAQNYAIECDVQISKDGEAMVFHDFALDRLTASQGLVADAPAQDLQNTAYRDGTGTIPTLSELLAAIAGRTPLIVEIKSRFDGDLRLAERVAAIAAAYTGPLAIKSFDPAVLRACRAAVLACPIGFLGEAHYDDAEWSCLSAAAIADMASFSFYEDVRPDFLSWAATDLPHAAPRLCRDGIGMPVMAWTVRSAADAARIAPWADQIVFEGFAA